MSGYGALQVIFGDWPWYMLAGCTLLGICLFTGVALLLRKFVQWICQL